MFLAQFSRNVKSVLQYFCMDINFKCVIRPSAPEEACSRNVRASGTLKLGI